MTPPADAAVSKNGGTKIEGRGTAGVLRPTTLHYLLSSILMLCLASCDGADPGTFAPEVVVEAYLIADEPLPPVRLSRTAPVNQTYDFRVLAVRDASVRLSLLSGDGRVEATYPYPAARSAPGVYLPLDAGVRVLPLRTYRLEVDVPGAGRPIAATTVVPDTFRVVGANTGTVVYQSTEQLELSVTRSASPGRTQNYFIFVTESLDPRVEQLTPLVKALFERQEGDVTLEDLRVGGSPVLSEANYDINPDGTLTIKYPWLAVAFYGPNRIRANALDDNLYDYIRSQSVQQGGSTFSPGEIPNPIEHIEGARGVFGSYARVSYDLFVLRPSEAGCAVIGSRVVCGEAAGP